MATVVWHEKSQGKFVVLGAGFGATEVTKAHWLVGEDHVKRTSQQHTLICVADAYNKVGWIQSNELTVISVDGYSPADLLK